MDAKNMKIIYKINDIKKKYIKENLEATSKKQHSDKTIIISTLEYFKKKRNLSKYLVDTVFIK
jgi:hypothetical protein